MTVVYPVMLDVDTSIDPPIETGVPVTILAILLISFAAKSIDQVSLFAVIDDAATFTSRVAVLVVAS